MRLFLVLSVFFLTGCESDRIANLEQQNREIVKKLDAMAARAPDLELQSKCAKQAKVVYDDGGWTAKDIVSYESHYNPKLNKCFCVTSSTSVQNGAPFQSIVLMDAFEGKQFGSYSWTNPEKKKFWEVAPFECWVKPMSGDTVTCTSKDEFEKLVLQYME